MLPLSVNEKTCTGGAASCCYTGCEIPQAPPQWHHVAGIREQDRQEDDGRDIKKKTKADYLRMEWICVGLEVDGGGRGKEEQAS